MSVFDREPRNDGCLSVCLTSKEDPNQDVLKQQSNRKKQQSNQRVLSTEDQEKKDEIDTLLSDAMNELTFEERQHQQEVLHGVDKQITEEAPFIESALQELASHLMRTKQGSVYETAERMDPEYVRAKPFRLMFLRCNQYDGKAAADQLLLFFKVKKELFGTEKLVREITIEDLDEDDRASLETGWVQFVGKDSSDRVVYMHIPGLRAFKELRNELRGKYYFMMKLLLSDEETQRKGTVGITYSVANFRDNQNGSGYIEHAQLVNAIPLKNAAVHVCVDDISECLLFYLGIKVMPVEVRSRMRCHFGSHLECQYQLATFGISKMLLPIDTTTGAINLEPHKLWFQSCLPTEVKTLHVAKPPSPSTITQPSDNDVLYDGKSHNFQMGNKQLRTLVVEWSEVYDSGNFETKRDVVDKVIGEIKKSGGRFLQGENGLEGVYYFPVPGEQLRRKVAQMFRNRRRRRKTP